MMKRKYNAQIRYSELKQDNVSFDYLIVNTDDKVIKIKIYI